MYFSLVICLAFVVGFGSAHEWNVTDWWAHNHDYDHKPSKLVFQRSIFRPIHRVIHRGRPGTRGLPRSEPQDMKNIILTYFNEERTYLNDDTQFRKIKDNLKEYLKGMGLSVAEQHFWPPETSNPGGREASNLIAIKPGPNRGRAGDEILILGAHYDTVRRAPGVDDNGSGSAAVLEVARLLTRNGCTFDKTLIFVLFDQEEIGLKGSKHFIKDYLIPTEINTNGAKVVGGYMMDMVLEYDPREGSQLINEWTNALPEWVEEMKQNKQKADFAAVWARQGGDIKMYEALNRNWLNRDKYKLSLMAAPLPELGKDLDADTTGKYKVYSNMQRSDHASFWYPTDRQVTFPTILISDMGPWRVLGKTTYHTPQDGAALLTDDNLGFVSNTVNSVVNTVFDLADGQC